MSLIGNISLNPISFDRYYAYGSSDTQFSSDFSNVPIDGIGEEILYEEEVANEDNQPRGYIGVGLSFAPPYEYGEYLRGFDYFSSSDETIDFELGPFAGQDVAYSLSFSGGLDWGDVDAGIGINLNTHISTLAGGSHYNYLDLYANVDFMNPWIQNIHGDQRFSVLNPGIKAGMTIDTLRPYIEPHISIFRWKYKNTALDLFSIGCRLNFAALGQSNGKVLFIEDTTNASGDRYYEETVMDMNGIDWCINVNAVNFRRYF
ncbi:hypothetical protein ACFL56_02550 [Candidatus Margulisiibacteriota bacterium]